MQNLKLAKKKLEQIRKKQGGFSLVELAVVLVVIGVIILGVTQSGSDQKEVAALDTQSKATIALVNDLTSYYDGNQTGYTGVTNTIASQAGLVPSAFNDDGAGAITHHWLGNVTITAGTINTAGDSSSVALETLPGNKVCADLTKKVSELVDVIDVDGTVVKAFNADLDQNALAGACDAATVDVTLLTR